MYAQLQTQPSADKAAAAARLILEASEAYSASNSTDQSHVRRLQARNRCRELLHQALTLEPEHPAALGLLGRVEMDDGHMELARELFDTSLQLQPEQPQQYCNLGYWALKSERPAQAEQYFLQALELDRQSAAAFCGVAHAKRQQGQFDVAYLHYRRLLEAGADTDSVCAGMLACAAHLEVHKADPALARDAITLLRRDGLPHQDIARFAGAILYHRYGLNNPDASLRLDTAASDELLLLALQKLLIPNPAVEELVVALRRAILAEVAQTVTLRDELQPLALAIALYADRTGYALATQDDEERLLDAINQSLLAQCVQGEDRHSMIGSLMVSAMYGALFHQDFAVHLGQWSLTDWPLALQPVLAASYYHRAEEEAIKQNFAEKADELCLHRADIPTAWPAWSSLPWRATSSLKTILTQELGLSPEPYTGILRIMVCGARSGQRALELARYLEDVEVIAVDENLANVAQATRKAGHLGLDNIVFWPWSVARRFVADGHQVHWLEVERLPSPALTDLSLAGLISEVAATGAVVHLHTGISEQTSGDRQIRQLIREHQLSPDRRTLQQLRQIALAQAGKDNHRLPDDDGFYSLGGCHDRWFRPQDSRQLQELLVLLSNEVDWKLVKARDADGHSLALAPVQQQIRAGARGNEVPDLAGQDLSLYFQRRR